MTQKNNIKTSVESTKDSNTKKNQTPDWLASNSLRFGVYFIDIILLMAMLAIIGFLLSDLWSSLGQWSHIIGYLIAVLYFGIQNSHLRQGQTLAKKLFKIRVMDKDHNYLSVGKACLRAGILSLPFALNNINVDLYNTLANQLIGAMQSIIIFGGFLTIVYLLISNKDTKQNIHDLFVGSYVLNLKVIADKEQSKQTELQDFENSFNKPFPTANPKYKKVIPILLVISAIAPVLVIGASNGLFNSGKVDETSLSTTLNKLSTLRYTINKTYPNIINSNLSYNTTLNFDLNTNTTTEATYLFAQVTVNDKELLNDDYARKIAQTLKQHVPIDDKTLRNVNNIEVLTKYGYDLYLVKVSHSHSKVFEYGELD